LLLDQRRFPRDKVCGDFVGPSALAEIKRMGLLAESVFRNANRIRQAALYLDGAKLIGRQVPRCPGLPDYGLCIPRLALDHAILKRAIASGARVLQATRVTGYEVERDFVTLVHENGSGKHQIKVRLLIGADGSSSLISRILRNGPPPRRDRILAVRAYFDEVECPSEQAELYFSTSTFPGYSWLFPTGRGSANVGVGMLLETWPPPKQRQLSELLIDLIKSDRAAYCRLSTAKLRGKIVGWPLATFNPALAVASDRVILIGDAAGLINPLNGEGIQYAFQSARWAYESLAVRLERDDLTKTALASYATRVQDELRYDMAMARLIIDLISNRTLNPIWLQALRIITQRAAFDDEYAKLAGAILAGIAPARSALSFRILWGTVQQAAIAMGYGAVIEALHGPGRLWKTGSELAQATASIALESLFQPAAFLSWGLNCVLSATELAGQVMASALQAPSIGDPKSSVQASVTLRAAADLTN
jgi:geranylgeranyl reductase family protein